MPTGVSPKAEVFLSRYLALARALPAEDGFPDGVEASLTVADLMALWQVSARAVRDTLARLSAWGLVRWRPAPGRAQRSALRLLVHPVHVYFARAERAEAGGRWAEAAFWYGEILSDCPCIDGVEARLRRARSRLGLHPGVGSRACCAGS